VLPSPGGPADAIVAFSAHSVLSADIDPDAVHRALPGDDPGAPMSAPFVAWVAETIGAEAGSLDVVLVADPAPSGAALDEVEAAHPRVVRAQSYRDEISTWTDPDRTGLAILGRGLAGRLEVSVEVEPQHRGTGRGRVLAAAARGLVPAGEHLFAQVAPGNVASLRAFLAAGYRPIGAEVLFLRRIGPRDA
jgi:GNAT superfamily N-acetyltransferase